MSSRFIGHFAMDELFNDKSSEMLAYVFFCTEHSKIPLIVKFICCTFVQKCYKSAACVPKADFKVSYERLNYDHILYEVQTY